MEDKKPLKIPVMDNLDDLTDDELNFYFNYWDEEIKKDSRTQNTIDKYTRVTNEVMRRYNECR
jgi:hypothetical protein